MTRDRPFSTPLPLLLRPKIGLCPCAFSWRHLQHFHAVAEAQRSYRRAFEEYMHEVDGDICTIFDNMDQCMQTKREILHTSNPKSHYSVLDRVFVVPLPMLPHQSIQMNSPSNDLRRLLDDLTQRRAKIYSSPFQ